MEKCFSTTPIYKGIIDIKDVYFISQKLFHMFDRKRWIEYMSNIILMIVKVWPGSSVGRAED